MTFEGEFYRLKDLPMEPKASASARTRPSGSARIARRPTDTSRCSASGHGRGVTVDRQVRGGVALLRRVLAEAGRDPAAFPVAKRVYIAVDPDRGRARRPTEWFGAFYHRPQLAEEVSVWGSVRRPEGLRAVVAAGAGVLMLNPVFDDEEQLERFAADLAPRL